MKWALKQFMLASNIYLHLMPIIFSQEGGKVNPRKVRTLTFKGTHKHQPQSLEGTELHEELYSQPHKLSDKHYL